MGVVSHLHSTVAEIERYVEPQGEIGRFLAMRYKAYETDHAGWSKEIWDMAPVAWLLDESWVPTELRLDADPDRPDHLQHRPFASADALRQLRQARPDHARLHPQTRVIRFSLTALPSPGLDQSGLLVKLMAMSSRIS